MAKRRRPKSSSIIESGARAVQIRHETIPQRCRRDPVLFNRYVLRDEESGKALDIAPMHHTWHDIISEENKALILGHLESGKSQQISVGRVLWELGNNHDLRVVIVSSTSTQAQKFLFSIRKYIESSDELHRVFPDLRPGEEWTDSAITVQRTGYGKDSSVQVMGVGGHPLGARIDLLILDDVLDFENTRTAEQRLKLYNWLKSELFGRSKRIIGLGNAYHPRDAFHQLGKEGWKLRRYPVVDAKTGESRWPKKWTKERIEEQKFKLGPLEFARQMLCLPRDDGESRFRKEWIEVALDRGRGKVIGNGFHNFVPNGYKVITGVDLNVQQNDGADLACLFTIIVHPNEDREVLEIEAGRWGGPETFRRLLMHGKRWMPHAIIVENNGAQDFFIQFTSPQTALPIIPFTTGVRKASPEFGIESIGVEMMHGKWIVPSKDGAPGELSGADEEIDAWIEDMLMYQPAKHTGDRLMASWLAREGVHLDAPKVEWGRLRGLQR